MFVWGFETHTLSHAFYVPFLDKVQLYMDLKKTI